MSYHCEALFFSAHPDDAEFAVGGTLLLLSKSAKVINVILTRGEAGTFGSPSQRENEARAAGSFGGFEVRFLDFKDNFVEDNARNAHILAQVIRECKPRLVFAPYHSNATFHIDGLSHPDHTSLGKLALKAVRFAKFKNAELTGSPHLVERMVYYMVPYALPASFVVDVSSVEQQMSKLWHCHASQLSIDSGRLEEKLLLSRKSAGMLNKLALAERFLVEEPIVVQDILKLR